MIITRLENVIEQVLLNQNMEMALNFLHRSDLQNLPAGKIEINGTRVFAMIQTYETKFFNEQIIVEGHKKYIDIQYLVNGQELIGWVHAADTPMTTLYDENKDAWLATLPLEKTTLFKLLAGQAAILYPTDAHAPQLANGQLAIVKKIVIKVAVS
jgi:YhcH/YjgK/YiaL family protein